MSVLIDKGLSLAAWLLPGLLMVVVLLLAFSTVDRRQNSRSKESKQDGERSS